MIFKNLKDKNIILGSSSERRQELLNNLGLKFRVELKKFDEKFPQNLARLYRNFQINSLNDFAKFNLSTYKLVNYYYSDKWFLQT